MEKDRILHLYGLISPATTAPVLREIISINNHDNKVEWEQRCNLTSSFTREPIHLHINSRGGDLFDAFPLLSVMEASQTPIFTYCYGYAMSVGLMIFVAGHKRYGGKYAVFTFHQLHEDLNEQRLLTEIRLDHIKRMRELKMDYLCEKTDLVSLDFEENKCNDWLLDVYTAQELGIVDELISQ